MPYRAQIDDHGVITRYKDTDTGQVISAKDYERMMMMQQGVPSYQNGPSMGNQNSSTYPIYVPGAATAGTPGTVLVPPPPASPVNGYPAQQGAYPAQPSAYPAQQTGYPAAPQQAYPTQVASATGGYPSPYSTAQGTMPGAPAAAPSLQDLANSPLIQPGAQRLDGSSPQSAAQPAGQSSDAQQLAGSPAGQASSGKNLRLETAKAQPANATYGYKTHGFLDATSIAILLPTLVLLALIIAAAHKKRLFPWQTIRTFNPPSGLMTPRDYERSYVCPPNLRRHGRLGKRNPTATWTDTDGIVLPFGFLARTHLPITIPLGKLPNKNMFIVAPSGSGKTTLMRAIIKALMAKPCVIVALEAKANDPALDEKREGFKHTLLPEAAHAGFETLYFNPLDVESVHWNPLDLDPITFASSIVQDVNSLPPEEQHWAERDHGYIAGLTQLLKWGAFMVAGEDENGQATDVQPLPCNPRGLMRLVNNRRNIVESLRRCKNNPNVQAAELSELTQTLSSIIRTDSDWDKNIQGVRGRLRMFKNPNVLRCTEASNIDIRQAMYKPTVLIFGAPASMGPDAESLASCFVYQLQNAMHYRYGTASVLPLFAFFDEYQTLNMDIAGRLSAIVRGANGGLTIILQNISQIAQLEGASNAQGISPELKTIFSNSAVRVCLHNADEATAKFFSDEIGKHAIIVPGISDHYDANGFGVFPTSWNRIHSQQVVARVDADSIKRMEKHHALIFLSPAGDPEFGELKPFMCDLRGIEEIARLHLLHNVAGRGSPSALPGPQGQGQIPPGALPPGAIPGQAGMPGGTPSMPGMAAAARGGAANQPGIPAQMMEKAGQMVAGAVQGAMQGAAPMPAPAGQGASAMGGPPPNPFAAVQALGALVPGQHPQGAQHPTTPGAAAAGAAGFVAGAAIGAMAANAMNKPPFPGAAPQAAQPQQPALPPGVAAPNPALAGAAQPRPAASIPQAQPPVVMPAVGAAAAQPAQPAPRTCGKCGKWPGKGRFCIECGTFVGQPGAPQQAQPAANPQVPMSYPSANPAAPQAMPANAPAGYPPQPMAPQPAAPGQAGAQQRAPLTTLHADMGKYGVPKTAQPSDQPGQQPIPRPQQRGGGIEF